MKWYQRLNIFLFWWIMLPMVYAIRCDYHYRCKFPKVHKKRPAIGQAFYKFFGMSVNWPQ